MTLDTVMMLALLLNVWVLLQMRKAGYGLVLLAIQAVLISFHAVWVGVGDSDLWMVGMLTLLVKGILVPLILWQTMRRIRASATDYASFIAKRYTPSWFRLAMTALLSVAGWMLAGRLHLPVTPEGEMALPFALILFFCGVFLVLDHKHVILQGIGLLTLENGLGLMTMSLRVGLPFWIEVGNWVDLVVSALVIGILAWRIHAVFQRLDTENMQQLRG